MRSGVLEIVVKGVVIVAEAKKQQAKTIPVEMAKPELAAKAYRRYGTSVPNPTGRWTLFRRRNPGYGQRHATISQQRSAGGTLRRARAGDTT